jgi:hypothetical protein
VPDPPNSPIDSAPGGRALFRPAATTVFRVALCAVVLGTAAAGYAAWQYYHSAYWTRIGFAPDQPVLFSHRHHAGELRIDCRYCHATVETSPFAGMPSTRTCLTCHSQIFTMTAMLQPVVASATRGEPLQWTRVTRLPDHVFFDHSIHVAKRIDCATCHGDVRAMALLAKAEPMTMRWCLDCHRDPGTRVPAASLAGGEILARPLTNCSTCHH